MQKFRQASLNTTSLFWQVLEIASFSRFSLRNKFDNIRGIWADAVPASATTMISLNKIEVRSFILPYFFLGRCWYQKSRYTSLRCCAIKNRFHRELIAVENRFSAKQFNLRTRKHRNDFISIANASIDFNWHRTVRDQWLKLVFRLRLTAPLID